MLLRNPDIAIFLPKTGIDILNSSGSILDRKIGTNINCLIYLGIKLVTKSAQAGIFQRNPLEAKMSGNNRKDRRLRMVIRRVRLIAAIAMGFSVMMSLWVTRSHAATVSYSYDALSRLTQVAYDSGTVINYVYDAAGNRLLSEIAIGTGITRGDVDGNGSVTLEDVILVLQICSGIPVEPPIHKDADVNGDSKIGLEEAVYILQKLSELR